MDYKNLTAPCGLDCFNCPMYLANTDSQLRKKISERLGIAYETSVCAGCRNEKGKIAFQGMKNTCKTYCCAQEKNVDFCHECADFPCDNLHPFLDQASVKPHNTKIFNLCLIKKMGLENWAEKKAADVKNNYFKGKLNLNGD
ncbi:MAG TPA: hypothetical protein DHW82_04705 [Spirochaetia bacterium]|nr:MAG: hypothetical protein A2Y41_08545 [Spirochaetes bacterium GWB1_36_13]HCL56294.1 hypothetical protein [Spirochaetia bacterium]